ARSGVRSGHVVDLGCGGGTWARTLVENRYAVTGIDLSPAMIALARQRTPEATFHAGSFFVLDLPPCDAITCLGEGFNYAFDDAAGPDGLLHLFQKIHAALHPGGVLLFDIALPGQAKPSPRTGGKEGEGWAILFMAEEDREAKTLTRRITTFREVEGGVYRREHEIHQQRLYEKEEIAELLEQAGFRSRSSRGYGAYKPPRPHAVFVATRP
ncbi:MAG TPA: class I SAM-dependent methyltransferase, partial [Thermoanaerobaculia bacterium]